MSVIHRALYKRKHPDRKGCATLSRKELKALAQHDMADCTSIGYKAKQPHWELIDVKANNIEAHYLWKHSVTGKLRVT